MIRSRQQVVFTRNGIKETVMGRVNGVIFQKRVSLSKRVSRKRYLKERREILRERP